MSNNILAFACKAKIKIAFGKGSLQASISFNRVFTTDQSFSEDEHRDTAQDLFSSHLPCSQHPCTDLTTSEQLLPVHHPRPESGDEEIFLKNICDTYHGTHAPSFGLVTRSSCYLASHLQTHKNRKIFQVNCLQNYLGTKSVMGW